MKRDAFDIDAEFAELMEVAVTGMSPIVKFDAELEARPSGAYEFALVDAEYLVEELQRWNRGLADADRADLFLLYQTYPLHALQRVSKAGGCHPARRSAADDHVVHGVCSCRATA
jgi:hypothetical protein